MCNRGTATGGHCPVLLRRFQGCVRIRQGSEMAEPDQRPGRRKDRVVRERRSDLSKNGALKPALGGHCRIKESNTIKGEGPQKNPVGASDAQDGSGPRLGFICAPCDWTKTHGGILHRPFGCAESDSAAGPCPLPTRTRGRSALAHRRSHPESTPGLRATGLHSLSPTLVRSRVMSARARHLRYKKPGGSQQEEELNNCCPIRITARACPPRLHC